jgi:hypothetical protein
MREVKWDRMQAAQTRQWPKAETRCVATFRPVIGVLRTRYARCEPSGFVMGFGRRPPLWATRLAPGAVVRKPPEKEPAIEERVTVQRARADGVLFANARPADFSELSGSTECATWTVWHECC